MKLGRDAWNLHFKLDEEPFHVQFDGNHAHVFKNVSPGTHTVRVYAANELHEAIPGTQSTVTFSVGYPSTENAPIPGAPVLTYNLPQGEYLGIDAADITVDFLVENAVLSPGGYQVAYYVDGRRFLVQDACGPRHLKNLTPGYHRVRIELQDANGDLVPGAFNSTERTILVSPDSYTKSPSDVIDGYPAQPRLDSIKGRMTMGREWTPEQQNRRLTIEQQKQQQSLTVETGHGTVNLDGEPVANIMRPDEEYPSDEPADSTARVSPPPATPVSPNPDEFVVRQGGEPVIEDTPATSSIDNGTRVRSGSIVVNTPDDDDAPAAAVNRPVADDSAGAPDDDRDETVVNETVTTRTTRTRADGTSTTLKATTATLRLADRPTTRTRVERTTTTVSIQDALSSQPKVTVEEAGSTVTRSREGGDDRRGSGTRGERGERGGSFRGREGRPERSGEGGRRGDRRGPDTGSTTPAAQSGATAN